MFRQTTIAFFLAIAAGCGSSSVTGDAENLTELTDPVEKAAYANLKRISAEIDAQHMANYATIPSGPTFGSSIALEFVKAVKAEYAAKPELLKKRMQTLASMVFFSNPEVKTDATIGRITPFHGMDDSAFEALMRNEDVVFDSHMEANQGSPNGVRPFSVCETKYLIDIATGKVTDAAFVANKMISNYDAYAQAFKAYAASCAQADLDEWYNFRGLGGLRPSWLESNYNDRVLRRMLKQCKNPTADNQAACTEFAQDRLAYRDRKNIAMALREMVWDTDTTALIGNVQDGDYMRNPGQGGVFLEDQNGDGIAEWLAVGSASLKPGSFIKLIPNPNTFGGFDDMGNELPAPSGVTGNFTVGADGASLVAADGTALAFTQATLDINSTGQFGGELTVTISLPNNVQGFAKPGYGSLNPVTRVMSGWDKSFISQPDLGLSSLLRDGDCTGDRVDDEKCPLIRRFYSMIDRHENFYQTYSTFDPKFASVSSQPSPLVACSITLSASHAWDHAGTPAGGTAGFIYLMRIPFAQILSGDVRSIDTLGRLKGDLKSGPAIIKLQDIVSGARELEMNKVWLDIATLSNNQYSSEHEVSKFGTVPAEQIEGVLVIRQPAAMGGGVDPGLEVPEPNPDSPLNPVDPAVAATGPTGN